MELAANKIFRTVAATPANYSEGNYQIKGELRVKKSPSASTFTTTLTAKLTPDENDNAVFEIQDGLADFFPFTDFNPYGVVDMQLCTDNIVEAQFYQAESYGDPQVDQSLSLVDTFKAINGGIPKQIADDFITETLPVTKQFLTWHPSRKRVTQSQPELLHFLVYDENITELNLIVKVYFTDGTNTTVTKDTVTSVVLDQVYRMPAGYTALGLSLVDGTKRVQKYDISLTDQADAVVSEVRTYVVDYLDNPDTRYWLFSNSLGMFEVMRTEGKGSAGMEIERETSSGFLPNGYDRSRGELQSRVLGSVETLRVSSGFLDSKDEALWAKEILLSEKVFLITADQRIPYRITTKNYQPFQDKDYKWYLRFDAVLAYNNTKYAAL